MSRCQGYDAGETSVMPDRVTDGGIGAEALPGNDDPPRSSRLELFDHWADLSQRLLVRDIIFVGTTLRSGPGHSRHEHYGTIGFERGGQAADKSAWPSAFAVHKHNPVSGECLTLRCGVGRHPWSCCNQHQQCRRKEPAHVPTSQLRCRKHPCIKENANERASIPL